MKRLTMQTMRRTGLAVAAGLLAAGAVLWGGTGAHASDLEVYDKGEHLLFPEGPIHQDGIWLIPLRAVAERFGYTFAKVTLQEVALAGGAMGSVTLYPGQATVVVNGSVKRAIQAPPQFIHGTLFVPLDFIGELTDIGYSVAAGTEKRPTAIQLRPGDLDAASMLDEQYWVGVNAGYGNVTFLNGKGEIKQTFPTSPWMSSFGYGELMPVYKNGSGRGFIDRTGKLAVPASHYRLNNFSEGLAVYTDLYPVNDLGYEIRSGYVNRNGDVMSLAWAPVPIVFDRAYPFSDGLAKVVQGGKTFYIDHNGKTAIPPIPGSLHTASFNNGLAAVEMNVRIDGKLTARTGFIDTKGKFVIPPTYERADDFADNGLAAAVKDGKYGYIDAAGKWAIAPQFDSADGFQANFAVVWTTTPGGTVLSLIDAGGNKVKLPPHGSLGRMSQGLIAYESGGLWGYADTQGRVVIAPQFARAEEFGGGIASVMLKEDGGKHRDAYIDKTGNTVWKSEFVD